MRWIALLMIAGCSSTAKDASLRELPVGMAPLGSLLDGCTPAVDGSVTRASCENDVVLSMQTRHAIIGEPYYRSEAFALAQESGARLVWDQITVPTEGPSGVLDRARAMAPLDETPKGVLLGVVRSLGERDVQEVWCTARDDSGDRRCRDLIGAVLSGKIEKPTANEGATKRAVPVASGPVTLFGRSVSLPTSCGANPIGGGAADASCEDGASASWRRFGSMEEASETVTATLAALGTEGEPQAFPCVIGGEAAQCEEHDAAVAGLTYIDGKAVGVLCLADRSHALCRALIHEK